MCKFKCFVFLLAAFSAEQIMAKAQEVLIFYFGFAFTAKKRTLLEVFFYSGETHCFSAREHMAKRHLQFQRNSPKLEE